MIDVGVDYHRILSSINYDISNLKGIICSHRHGDHTKSLDRFIKIGIPCFGNNDICESFEGCNPLSKKLNVGGFKIQHFDLIHNVPNTAFIIDTPNNIRILYCTDTEYIPMRVKNVNYAIIEANYDEDDIIENYMEDTFGKGRFDNHQSLENCIEYLRQIYNPRLRGIILWHLSSTNINSRKAYEKVRNEFGFDNVVVAKKNVIISLKTTEI